MEDVGSDFMHLLTTPLFYWEGVQLVKVLMVAVYKESSEGPALQPVHFAFLLGVTQPYAAEVTADDNVVLTGHRVCSGKYSVIKR